MASAREQKIIFIGRLIGTPIYDPIGDQVGKVHDVVVFLKPHTQPVAIGLVTEVTGRKRVFLPLTRVTNIQPGAVFSTGLINLRRFEKRPLETLAMGELFDRKIDLADNSGAAIIRDVAIEQDKKKNWLVSELFVQRQTKTLFGFKSGDSFQIKPEEAKNLFLSPEPQPATALLETLVSLKPADLADALHDLPEKRRLEVACSLNDERLADVLEELGDEESISILSRLEAARAANVLDAMQPDDAADLIAELPQAKAKELLNLMQPSEAADVIELLKYDEYTAGGLMTTEPIILPPEATVATMLASVSKTEIPPALAAIAFIVRPPLEPPTGHFIGVVHIQRALREPPHRAVGSILDKDIEVAQPNDGIGKVTRLLATYNLTALPIVDNTGRLLGAVSVDDVLDHLMPEDWRLREDEIVERAIDRGAHA